MIQYDYVAFDLDGTLLDTRKGIISAVIRTLKKWKMSIPDQQTLENIIGPPMQLSLKTIYNLSDDKAMEIANCFREEYTKEEFLFDATPYDGIFDLLQELISKKINIGIATYKREDYAKKLLHWFGFDKFTQHIFGSDFDGKLKKHDIIRLCLESMGCNDYSNSVYVGDGNSDGKGANILGMKFIAVTYGFGFKPNTEIEYPNIGIANTPSDIISILR